MSEPLRVGAMFAGYGGLELGLSRLFDTRLTWVAEFDKAPSKILAHHWPDVPNLGDVTAVDWKTVEPVDVITGGSPCQDLSHAGKRQGMKPGTRSGLWAAMCRAIDEIRPGLVVWENVRGALSATASSDMEPDPGPLGDRSDGPLLRALGRVLGDLASLGYDAAWTGLRAADVGAPHGRFRIFVVAQPAPDAGGEARRLRPGLRASNPGGSRGGRLDDDGLPADDGPAAVALLPTPNPFHMGNTEDPQAWRRRRLDVFERTGTRHGPALPVVALSIAQGEPLDPQQYMPDDADDDTEDLP